MMQGLILEDVIIYRKSNDSVSFVSNICNFCLEHPLIPKPTYRNMLFFSVVASLRRQSRQNSYDIGADQHFISLCLTLITHLTPI